MEPARSLDAACPAHPEKDAVSTCARCGLFLCEGCLAGGDPPMCASCKEKASDPLGILAESFSIRGCLRNGWRIFTAVLGPIVLVSALFSVPLGVIGALVSLAGGERHVDRIDRLFDGTIGLLGTIACLALMVAVVQGRPRGIGWAFSESAKFWSRVFGANLWANLKILLFTLLLIVPGIMKALSLALVTPAAYLESHSVDTHMRSDELTRGHRWPLLGLYLVAGGAVALLVILFAMLLAGLGTLIDEPSWFLILNSVLVDWAGRVATIWLLGVTLAAYFGLQRLHDEGFEAEG